MSMNFGQQASRLIGIIRNLTHDEARILINLSYVSNCEAHGWLHLLKRWTLQTEPQYKSGTVTVTNGSNTVNLVNDGSSAWVTSWVTTPSMRRINISGRNEPYDVSALPSTTQATLADNWVGATNTTGLSYYMYRDTYPFPSDCGMHKTVALFDTQLLYRMWNFNQPKFLNVRADLPGLVAIPTCFTVVNQTSETPPRAQLQMYPAPSDVRVYHGWYFRRPAFLTADAQFLDWPTEFDDMIWINAAITHYQMPPTYSPKYLAEFKPMYADLFRRMKAAMDGQSAIDFEIEQAQLGRWGGGGSAWNPDPNGLSGSGVWTTGWGR